MSQPAHVALADGKKIVSENHDLQVRFKWSIDNAPGVGDVAIWDNRSTFHTVSQNAVPRER